MRQAGGIGVRPTHGLVNSPPELPRVRMERCVRGREAACGTWGPGRWCSSCSQDARGRRRSPLPGRRSTGRRATATKRPHNSPGPVPNSSGWRHWSAVPSPFLSTPTSRTAVHSRWRWSGTPPAKKRTNTGAPWYSTSEVPGSPAYRRSTPPDSTTGSWTPSTWSPSTLAAWVGAKVLPVETGTRCSTPNNAHPTPGT